MARVGQQVKSLDESDLLLPSATPTEQSTDDIKLSLNRIEELLNRGHQLLYGDEAGASEELGDSKDGGAGVDTDDPQTMTQQDVAGISSSTKSSHGQARELPQAPVYDAELSPLTPVSPTTASAHASVNVSPAAPASRKPSGGEPRRIRPRSRSGSFSQKPMTEDAQIEKEMRSLSASARGARLSDIKKKTGKVPALEEGVDENDKPQNVTIESLKERIHRELEEYRRNGPLMPGSRSAKPARKTNLSSTVPTKTAQSAPPAARSRFGFAATTTSTGAETAPRGTASRPAPARSDSRALTTTTTTTQPKPAVVRPRTNVVSSGYGRTRPATTTTTAAAAVPARGHPSTAATRPSNGTRAATTTGTAATRSRAAPAASRAPARRTVGTTSEKHTSPSATAPRATKAKPATRPRPVANEGHSGPQRVPVWERLYSHAAEQELSLQRRREMQRLETRAMANTTVGKAHAHRAARPSQQHYGDDSRPVPAQEFGVTQQAFRPLALDATRDTDVKNASMSTMRLSSNPRLSRSASMQRRSSGTTNVVPMVRASDEAPVFPIPNKAVVRKPATRQSPPPPANGLSPLEHEGPKAESVSPVPAPPPQVAVPRTTTTATKSTTPNPSKRLQLERPDDADNDTSLLDDEDDDELSTPPAVPQFVRPLDLRGIKK